MTWDQVFSEIQMIKDSLVPPVGKRIVTEGFTQEGDIIWSLHQQKWIPNYYTIGQDVTIFYGVAR